MPPTGAGPRAGDIVAARIADAIDEEAPQGLLAEAVQRDAPQGAQGALQVSEPRGLRPRGDEGKRALRACDQSEIERCHDVGEASLALLRQSKGAERGLA